MFTIYRELGGHGHALTAVSDPVAVSTASHCSKQPRRGDGLGRRRALLPKTIFRSAPLDGAQDSERDQQPEDGDKYPLFHFQ
jgi:hypothetical protein